MGSQWTNQMADRARVLQWTLFAVVVLKLTGLHASCQLEITPPSVVVHHGESLKIHCHASSLPENYYLKFEVPRGKTEGSNQSLTWSWESVNQWSFMAQCFATDGTAPECINNIAVTVYKYPKNVTITDKNGSLDIGKLDEGVNHEFLCSVTDVVPVQNVVVTWYIGNTTVKVHDGFPPSARPGNVLSNFTYVPRREHHGLHIRCQVHFNLGPSGPKETKTSQQHLLQITYPARNITHLKDTELEVGSSYKLRCFSDASPEPKYSWDYYKTGNVEVNEEQGASYLYIQNATDVNDGNYTCVAGNELGNVSHMARVTVKGAIPQCPIEVTPERLVMQFGHRKSVTCGNSTEDASRNMIDIYWRVGHRRVPGAHWTVDDEAAWDPKAECIATFSGIGECSKPYDVTFYKYPEDVTITDKNGMDIGKEINHEFWCNVTDVAPVQNVVVTWYIGNTTVKVHDGFPPSAGPGNVLSNFTYVPRREHHGLHIRCQVHFNLGPSGPKETKTSQQHLLQITYPARNITHLKDTELEVGSCYKLRCFSDASPEPKYSWDYYKTGNVEVNEEQGASYLYIQNATDVNDGNYTCVAGNELGNVSHMARVTVKGAISQCPIEVTPERLVMQFGHRKSVTCGNSTEDASRNMIDIYWRVGHRRVPGAHWTVDDEAAWDPKAECIAKFSGIGECSKPYDVTFYKYPEDVTITDKNGSLDIGKLDEEMNHEFWCNVTDVAPVQNVVVTWYIGNTTVKVHDGFPPSARPGNVLSNFTYVPRREHHGLHIRCQVHFNLGPSGPKETKTSQQNLLRFTSKPRINTTKLPPSIPVFKGYPEELVCEAEGSPAPSIHWSSDKGDLISSGNITVTEGDVWTCHATNEIGSSSHKVVVVLKEDYLPLIAGFVALTVFATSAIFVFFYSIYYKNTKMRRYNLKDPKLTENGHVAHNSWDSPLPMTKLS